MKAWLALQGGFTALASRGGKAGGRPGLWSKI
jgi:hypothetical protein